MNDCNRILFLPLEDDGLTVVDIILVYQTHSIIGYTTKEINCKFRPCHAKFLIEFGRHPCSARRRSPIPRRCCLRHSDRLSTPPSRRRRRRRRTSSSHCLTLGGGGRSRVCRRIVTVVSSHPSYDLSCL